jgi:hypothetical protein
MTPFQSAAFTQKMNEALDRQSMSWDNELKEWHVIALRALECVSPASIQIEAGQFGLLTHQLPNGLNMNVVMVLNSVMDRVSAKDLNLPLDRFVHYQNLNAKILSRWHTMTEPTRKKLLKEVEILVEPQRILRAGN